MKNYYKQGSIARADEIKSAFENKGFKLRYTLRTCNDVDMIYFSIDGEVRVINARNLELFKTHPDYKELELPKPHYDIANFNPFDKVLVKDSCCEKWVASLFSNYDKDSIPHHFVCIDSCYVQCVPFEGNEHLLGTTDPCDEMYINW